MKVIAPDPTYSDTLHHVISSMWQDVDRFTALSLEDINLSMVTSGDHTAPVLSEHDGFRFGCQRLSSQVRSFNIAGR